MKKLLILMILSIAFYACEPQKSDTEPVDETLSIENEFNMIRDSLLSENAKAMVLINEIDDSISAAAPMPETDPELDRGRKIFVKIDQLKNMLEDANKKIKVYESKIRKYKSENTDFSKRVETLETMIREKDEIIQKQELRISKLETELQMTREELSSANEQIVQITDRADQLQVKANTAYYVFGTKDELEEKGIIIIEGETLGLFGGKWIPNPEADQTLFTKIDIVKDVSLDFPNGWVIDEIVSAHERRLLELEPPGAGSAKLTIYDPEVFWKNDKRLIIIIEEE